MTRGRHARRVWANTESGVIAITVGLALLGFLGLPHTGHAQNAQRVSIQVSGLGAYPFAGGLDLVTFGLGWEAQGRWNMSAFSIGIGAERTEHEVSDLPDRQIVLTGGFLEPRYVIYVGGGRSAPYVSARIAVSNMRVDLGTLTRTGRGYTINFGGGVLLQLTDRVNLDAGATIGFKDLGLVNLPVGSINLGTGTNIVSRVGVAIGVG